LADLCVLSLRGAEHLVAIFVHLVAIVLMYPPFGSIPITFPFSTCSSF